MSYAAVLEQKEGRNQAQIWQFDLPFALGIWRVSANIQGVREIELLDETSTGSLIGQETEILSGSNSLPDKIMQWRDNLNDYLAGQPVSIEQIPIDWASMAGTPFQKRCWLALLMIPRGETMSYQWLAEQAGSPKAMRAAGQANGVNPIPLIIPCHRVVGANGKLTGYMRGRAGGLEIKRWLLNLEKAR